MTANSPSAILRDASQAMDKALEYLRSELRGIRTGRASTALVEFIKVEYYGTMTDLKSLAAISIPEPTQILIKPFDAGSVGDVRKAIEAANLGLNPQVDGKQIRVNIPALSGDRRKQLVAQARKLAEEAKVAVRNIRRDANKHADGLTKAKDAPISEDEVKTLKDEIQTLLKKHEAASDQIVEAKSKEIMEV